MRDAIVAAQNPTISPDERITLDAIKVQVDTAKAVAKTLLDQVPTTHNDFVLLTERYNAIGQTHIPTVDDVNGNGILDVEDLARAQAAITAATRMEQQIRDAVRTAQQPTISPEEHAALTEQARQLTQLIAAAQDALTQVPQELVEKANLVTQYEALKIVDIPEVDDVNDNGISDVADVQRAEAALAAARQAIQEQQQAIVATGGLITPTTHEHLIQLTQMAHQARAIVSQALSQVPDSNQHYSSLWAQYQALVVAEAPKVTDENANGILDSEDVANAKKAIEKAEALERELAEAINAAQQNPISPEARADLMAKKHVVDLAIAEARQLLTQVITDSESFIDLNNRSETVGHIELPEVDDINGNGVADAVDRLTAQAALAHAEELGRSLMAAIEAAKRNGITPAEHAALMAQAAQYLAAKQAAQALLQQVPQSESDDRAQLTAEYEQLPIVPISELTGANNTGILKGAESKPQRLPQTGTATTSWTFGLSAINLLLGLGLLKRRKDKKAK